MTLLWTESAPHHLPSGSSRRPLGFAITRALPPPDRAAEDAFLASWQQRDDIDGLAACVSDALAAGRPQLAGRLVGLLEGRVEIEPGSALDRARRVARLVVVARPEDLHALSEDLDRAWLEARQAHHRWVRSRMRARSQQASGVFLDTGGTRRREPRLLHRKRRR